MLKEKVNYPIYFMVFYSSRSGLRTGAGLMKKETPPFFHKLSVHSASINKYKMQTMQVSKSLSQCAGPCVSEM